MTVPIIYGFLIFLLAHQVPPFKNAKDTTWNQIVTSKVAHPTEILTYY